MNSHNFLSIVCILFLLGGQAWGQGNENSIYSRFGLGNPVDNNFMHLRTMGSIGSAYSDPYHINIENPASYALLRAVSFDVGVNVKLSSIDDGTRSQNIESGGLEYVSFAMPLRNKVNEILEREEKVYNFGMAFTLMPHTRVGYNISGLEETARFGEIERNFEGEGGTYKFLWGNAFRYKSFAIGLNLGYLFGNLEYSRNVFFDPSEFAYSNTFIDKYNIRGFIWNGGIQYSLLFDNDKTSGANNNSGKKLTFGLHYGTNTGYSIKSDQYDISILSGANVILTDTLTADLDITGDGTLPGELGLGLTYQAGEKFTFGFNYVSNHWSAYENSLNPDELSNSYKLSLGGYYRPNSFSQSSYWDRVYYRYGAYVGRNPQRVDNQEVNNYGITFGLGLPFIYQRRITHVNLGVELGSRGQGTLVEERFLGLNLAFTFNDNEWFLKRKYN